MTNEFKILGTGQSFVIEPLYPHPCRKVTVEVQDNTDGKMLVVDERGFCLECDEEFFKKLNPQYIRRLS